MKTIRLLYPDYVSGGMETYYFGANLLAHILPENEKQNRKKRQIKLKNGAYFPVMDDKLRFLLHCISIIGPVDQF